jgi:hypothetical protein
MRKERREGNEKEEMFKGEKRTETVNMKAHHVADSKERHDAKESDGVDI